MARNYVQENNKEYLDINCFADTIYKDDSRYCNEKSVPELSVLRQIIQNAFSVSCLFEEGRSLSFRICSFDIDNRPHSILGPGARVFRFNEPILFNTTNLRKIALSANPDRTMICVSSLGSNSCKELYITAILFFISTYEDLLLGNALSGYLFPNVLNIFVCGPGCISSCYGNTTLHTYKCGQIVST